MAVNIQQHAEGATLPLRVQPKAKRNSLLGEQAGALKVSVTRARRKTVAPMTP